MYPQSMDGRSETGLALPSFRKPPVVEVAMAIAFAPLPGLQFAALADLRGRWITDFPFTEEQPFLESPPTTQQSIKVEFGPPPRRIWLVSSQKDRVLQIQRDRLIANWRSIPPEKSEYPRYQPLRDEFLQRWADFEKFVAEQGIATSVSLQYAEVSYINVVRGEEGEETEISSVLKMNREGELWRENTRTTSVTQTWEFPDVHTTLTTAANIDNSAQGCPVVLHLTANTQVGEGRNIGGALDLAHDFVVGTFGVITTDEMQRRWERE
jgi:uncharacterized protein (TIGR04255 family)